MMTKKQKNTHTNTGVYVQKMMLPVTFCTTQTKFPLRHGKNFNQSNEKYILPMNHQAETTKALILSITFSLTVNAIHYLISS